MKSNKTTPKYSFGTIRIVLALLVIFEHSFILGGFGKDPLAQLTNSQISTALVAVMSFFVISGFLVTKSYLGSGGIMRYGLKRFMRIMPGFWACIVIVAFGFAPLLYFFENKTLSGFLSLEPVGPFDFIIQNSFLLIRHYAIEGILFDNPYPYVLNGSLWTLFLEAKAYVLLGILGLLGALSKQKIVIVLLYFVFFSFVASGTTVEYIPNPFLRLVLDHYFLIFLCYFFAGSLLYLYKERIIFSWRISLLLAFLTFMLAFFDLIRIGLAVALPYTLILLAMNIRPSIFDRQIDLSYGTYIYSFPVMQTIAFFGLNSSQILYFLLSILFTLPLAIFSWFVIEKPALGLKTKISMGKKTLPQHK